MRKTASAVQSNDSGTNVAGTGCSPLCFLLAALGLGLTTAATVFTYRVLHEQMESLGASVVDHMASSKCTAISKTLAALSVARSDVLNGEPEHERSEPAPSTVIGVVTPHSWTVEDFHADGITQTQAVAALQQLPGKALTGSAPTTVTTALERAPVSLISDLDSHSCSLGYGLNPSAVKVYPMPSLAEPAVHHHQSNDHQKVDTSQNSTPWVAFLYGPWVSQGQQKVAFALVNLNAATIQASGHDHTLNSLFPNQSGQLSMGVHVNSVNVLKSQPALHQAMPLLDEQDHKLLGLKVVPFANALLRTEMSVDHERLDRVPRRTAAFVFLMGLLATSAVVVVSRTSEGKLRQLNQALLEESRTDGLTRVANRRAWDEALNLEEGRRQRYGHSYGLVVVDLDGFKQINDQQGHQAGDQVLQMAAAQLAQQLRGTDLLARVGGDEFALLIFNPTPEGLEDMTHRLKQALNKAGIRASVGAAMSEAQATLDQTWAKADEAMYEVKSAPSDPTPQPTEHA